MITLNRKKILIVDDTKEYLQTAMNYIIEESVPYDLLGASNGNAALEIAENETPDLIIMDWEMPGMNGIETTRILKNNPVTYDIPIIISTGIRLTPLDLKCAFEAGASDFIRKPLEKTEFIARINSHLKLASYIAEIKLQALQIADAETIRFKSMIETLNTRIEENQASLMFHNNFLTNLTKQLESVKENENGNGEVQQIISSISQLKRQFATIHNTQHSPDDSFIKTLLQEHRDLTPQEIQLSYMLKTGLSTKEIATITFREESSVKVARSRLRKKLSLNDEANLVVFLQRF